MSVIDAVQRRLAGNPAVRTCVESESIRIMPDEPGGFEVGLAIRDAGYTVWFAGWHEEFRAEREALGCVAFGFSPKCRLKVLSAGGFDYRWTVESRQSGHSVEDSTTGLLLWPFWKRRTTRYLTNTAITWEETE